MDRNDSRWTQLKGGYRVLYDPRPALRRLESGGDGTKPAWDELWQELFHQGDVGESSYAAVPELVRIHRERRAADWNTYALVGTIELARDAADNPGLPTWLADAYGAAWTHLVEIAMAELPGATEATLVRSILGVLALEKQQRVYGRILLDFAEDEIEDLMGQRAAKRHG